MKVRNKLLRSVREPIFAHKTHLDRKKEDKKNGWNHLNQQLDDKGIINKLCKRLNEE